MKLRTVLCVAAMALPALSCVESQATIDHWLRSRTGPTYVNVTGAWTDTVWGTSYLKQQGSQVSGQVGSYTIEGRVHGRTLSLTLWHDNAMYYTATLMMEKSNALVGRYYRTTRQRKGWLMMLRRVPRARPQPPKAPALAPVPKPVASPSPARPARRPTAPPPTRRPVQRLPPLPR